MGQCSDQQLRLALKSRQSIEMGRFEWVNLDAVRQRAGPDWARLSGEINKASAHFIERCITSRDVLVHCENGFMLILGDLVGAAAVAKVAEISVALNRFLANHAPLKSLKVKAEARSVSKAEFASVLAAAKPIILKGGPAAVPAPTKAPDDQKPFNPPVRAPLKSVRTETSPIVARPACPAQIADISKGWNELGPEQSGSTDQDAQTTGETHPDADAQPEALFDEIVFMPFWDARREALTMQVTVPQGTRDGRTVFGRALLWPGADESVVRTIDHAVAIAAQRGFQELHKTGATGQVGIAVNYETLAVGSARQDYFKLLNLIPQSLRKHFAICVDGIPEGVPAGKLFEIFHLLQSYGSTNMVHLDMRRSDLSRFEGCGVDLFGCRIPEGMADSPDLDDDIALLMAFAKAANRLGAGCYLSGIDVFDEFNLAVVVGATHMAGEAICPPLQAPDPVRPVKAIDFAPSGFASLPG